MTSFLVTLNPSNTSAAVETMALMACRSNNRKQSAKLTISEFKEFFDLHHSEHKHYKSEVNFNFISIDRWTLSGWKNELFIQEVDIFDPEEEEEERREEGEDNA